MRSRIATVRVGCRTIIPLIGGNLTGDQKRTSNVTILDDFEQIAA
jgi:hypothetical protein